jgi:SAM-dependent methyltransferase
MQSQYDEIWASVPLDRRLPDWRLRTRFCLSLARSGERVLDLGCGDGPMLPVLAAAGCIVAGADPSGVALERAARRGPFDLQVIGSDGRIPFADSSFDGVWASEVLGQAEEPGSLLEEAARILRPGGWLGVTTPDSGGVGRLRKQRDSTTHRRYTRGSLGRELHRAGFRSLRVRARGGVPGARRLILARGRRP